MDVLFLTVKAGGVVANTGVVGALRIRPVAICHQCCARRGGLAKRATGRAVGVRHGSRRT